ncbi:hypothetical protein F0P96_12115 [Hymenobacter busanensis]|uniref:Uncharacterized protein n=2 Tax=Hymenobacter busanensis TaxID=2607656 RepID=A0A7L5A1H8_9BACT|nr:hypothetical protein F0P96_12115 [Hymenobacter busanensis]QHJ09659.1 hypothetical protein GUY19_09155 [Hymenobacter busanensis]
MLRGMFLYAAGDTAAALLLHDFHWSRLLGVALLGGFLYAREVPAFFGWIDRRVPQSSRPAIGWLRAALSQVYFNPLWILRHMVLLLVFTGQFDQIGWHLLPVAARSFALNAPVSLVVNYFIQNHVPGHQRFLASSLYSGLMAVYYAISATW